MRLRPWIPAAVVGVCMVAAAAAGLHVVLVVALALLTLLWVSNALQATGHGHLFKFAANAVRRSRKGDSAS
jgi:hypothetical protein